MNKRQFLVYASTAAAGVAGCVAATDETVTTPMAKAVFLFKRRPDMTAEEFRRYWREVHAPIGTALPGLRRYVQNHVSATLDGLPAPYDGFAELWFDDMSSLEQALASPESQAAMSDSANFLDMERIGMLIVEEIVLT